MSPLSIDGEDVELGGLILFKSGSQNDLAEAQYWSTNVNKRDAPNLVNHYLRNLAKNNYLDPKGLSVSEFDRRVALAPKASLYNPVKTTDKDKGVNQSDTIPFLVAAVLAGMLWLTVFSGAYMLLTSMLEEKLNKLLEMMLASTRFSEIILGKLLGVAALTLSMMAPYIIVGAAGVIWGVLHCFGLFVLFDARRADTDNADFICPNGVPCRYPPRHFGAG